MGFRNWIGFVFILSAAPLLHAENQSINRLKNPGFEYRATDDGTYGEKPEYWTKNSASGVFLVTDYYKRDGEKCLKIADTSTSLSAGMLSDSVSVNPGYVYTARVWIMLSTNAASAALYLRFYDNAGQQLSESIQTGGAIGTWGAVELTAQAPSNAVSARILLYSTMGSLGNLYFDSASLVLADEEVWDGGFDTASPGALPENWIAEYTHTGAVHSVQSSGGNNMMQLTVSSSDPCGVYRNLPVALGTPYRLSADVAAFSCTADLYLKFYSSTGTLLSHESASTTSSSCTNLVLEGTAPAGAAYARAVLCIPSGSVGSAYFDNVSFTENYTVKYAAPTAAGDGSGDSSEDAALYTSSTFWNGVKTQLVADPVKVVLLEGNYTSQMNVRSVGNAANHLLVCGEAPGSVNFSDDTNSDVNCFINVNYCTNMTLRHINFTAEENRNMADVTNDDHDYYRALLIRGSSFMSLEGLAFTDLLLHPEAACTVTGSQNITIKYCSFVDIGWELYDHCIYFHNRGDSLNVENCYFQDCNGVYIRYRSGTAGSVTGSTFLSTGTRASGIQNGDKHHWPFVQVSAQNICGTNLDEIVSDHLTVAYNTFTYENTSEPGYRNPFQIYVQGPAPVAPGHEGWYMVPPAIGTRYIENTSQNAALRNSYIRQYFHIDLMSDYLITNNTYSGCWPVLFTMVSEPIPATWWTIHQSLTAEDNCNLDALVGLD